MEDDPPLAVLNTAIEAPSPNDDILLEFKFPDNQQPYYVTLYFIEVTQLQPNLTITEHFLLTSVSIDPPLILAIRCAMRSTAMLTTSMGTVDHSFCS